jgi:raffinose/stachyose/melibiose transport system permease protein
MNSNTSKMNDNIQRWLMRLILILCAGLIIFPLIFVFLTSLKSSADFYTNIWGFPKKIAWENYEYAWNVAEIGKHFFTSLKVVSVTVLVTLFISSIAGYALAKLKIPFANNILISMFLLSMLPSEAIIMPMYIIISKLGFGGTYASLILPYIGWGLPITTYIYKNFFSTLPTSIIEAARMEGCTEGRTYFSIVMPIMLPATATNAIFLFLGWWGEMLWAAVELSTASIKTLPLGLTAFIQSAGTAWGPLSAASCIVLIPVVIVFVFFQRFFISGLTGGGSKG